MLPRSLKVGVWTYRIEEWPTRQAASGGKFGEVDYPERLIRIDTGYSRRQAAATLLHEILHCVHSEWELQVGDSAERLVSTMEAGLAAVWRDNPDVMLRIHRGLAEAGEGG